MIGRLSQRRSKADEDVSAPKSFDDFELKLGDIMRGERATMGKSLYWTFSVSSASKRPTSLRLKTQILRSLTRPALSPGMYVLMHAI